MKKQEPQDSSLTPTERISRSVLFVRGERVILDRELAAIYGVTTKRLNEQVKRNIERFPPDFMFQLTESEAKSSRSQFATLNARRGSNLKYQPHAFTEHGAVQAANVLNSPHAIAMGLYVVRVFVQLRQFASSQDDIRRALTQLEKRMLEMDEENRERFRMVYEVLDALTNSPRTAGRPIGFTADLDASD